MFKRAVMAFALLLLSSLNAYAVSFGKNTSLVSLSVTPEYKTLAKGQKSLSLIAKVDILPGWHIYWDNPGDTGDPTKLAYYDSPHYAEIESAHSAPKKSVFENIITSYVYQKTMYFKTDFALKNLNDLSRLPFNLILSYTACSTSCQPETIRLDFALPISETAEKNPSYLDMAIAAENTFPVPLPAAVSLKDELLELKIEEHILKDCAEPEFISRHPKKSVLSDLPSTIISAPDSLNINFDQGELPPDFNGVLLCPGHAYYVEPQNTIAPAAPEKTGTPEPSTTPTGALYYVLTAFLAGLILNLMPCVLPVLGLKALYLANHKEKASPLSALSYALGVIASFLVLSGIIFYLKEKGAALGWGFQLQSPTFNAILLLLFFIIFLNLTDKLPLPGRCADKLSKFAGSSGFLTGFFAVIIACPCTGPFMGAAVGYAITTPPHIYFSIFLSLALGYALPYALIESFPGFFLKFIPRPGHWMITLKHILSLPIALTCFWLGWVIFNQLRPNTPQTEITWQPYTAQTLETALKENRPVFINFTAKWCLVCLLNDKTTLSTAVFKGLAQKHNLALIKADWTNRGEDIAAALKTYGRNSIPLYVYYAPNESTPQILPQILTTDILKNAIIPPDRF